MNHRIAWTALSLASALVACGDDLCRPGDLPPQVTIGTGAVRYEPFGDTVELVHGPQGGFHVLIGLLGQHLSADGLLGAHLSGTIGGVEAATADPWMSLSCTEDGQEFGGIFLIYDRQPEELDGQLTHITATLTDLDGTALEAQADVTIVDPLL